MTKTKMDDKRLIKTQQSAKTRIFIVSVLILSLLIAACTSAPNANNTNYAGANQNQQTQNSGKIKFADTGLASRSYLISGASLDPAAVIATAGFRIDKSTLSDGSVQISLTPTSPGYRLQTYTLTSGQKLYFIETNGGDDSGNLEFNLGDDNAVVVDANGYIV